MDESGNHDLTHFNPSFPVFTLCGVIMSEESSAVLFSKINALKTELWGDKKINFHSRDIRKCQNGFEVLFDLDKKKFFYDSINHIVKNLDYCIISATIDKERYKNKYINVINVYNIALEFIIERTFYFLNAEKRLKKTETIDLNVIVEKRGKVEDTMLLKHYNQLRDKGTDYIKSAEVKSYFKSFTFECKDDNNCGLEFADLIAYPIARYVINPQKANPAFDTLRHKIYTYKGEMTGLKVFP